MATGLTPSPTRQAQLDADKSKRNPVRSLKDMTEEERERVLSEINSVDREVARRRAEAARKGKR